MKKYCILFFAVVLGTLLTFNPCKSIAQTTLIATNASWKYLDNGSNQGTAWRAIAFNDASWLSGAAELGFGDSPTTKIVSGKIGYYFRKIFAINDPALYSGYVLKIRRDDGIVIYVNNTEVYRNNMPSGIISYNTKSLTNCSDDGNTTLTVNLPTTYFTTGNNIITAEVHNFATTSGDITFVLQLLGNPLPCSLPDINSSGTDSITLNSAKIFWNAIPGVQSYNFKYRVKNTSTYSTPVNSTIPIARLSNLLSSTVYEYCLQSVCPGNVLSAYTIVKSFTTLANPCVTPNVNMFGTIDKTPTSAKVYWAPINDNPSYNVRYRKRNVGASYSSPILTLDTFLVLNNLQPLTNYEFTVQSICNASLSSSVSSSGWFTTLASPPALALTRGPYLTVATKDSISIQWRTNVSTNSFVKYGISNLNLNDSVTDSLPVIDHTIILRGLLPNTKYFYSIGTTTSSLQGDINNFFYTAPENTVTEKMKFWVTGDFGNGSSIQTGVRNSFINFAAGQKINGWLWLGDNAYVKGTDLEYQSFVFNVYSSQFKNIPLFPTPGNHDYASIGYQSVGSLGINFPYFSIFNLPLSSGTEKYYSTNYGNIHFISLDSYGAFNDSLSPMFNWLKNDLTNNTQKWTIVFFHHPPYSKGSHNSDIDIELVNMRRNIVPLLESFGVDLVLSGHSHNYERSYFIKNHFDVDSTFNSTLAPVGNVLQSGGGPYYKTSNNDSGTVYLVCGVSGEIGTQTSPGFPHDAMFTSINNISGSLILEIDSDTLTSKFLTNTGSIADQFSIIKTIAPSIFRQNKTVTEISNDIEIYPNPSDGNINIRINNSVDQRINVSISDITGKIIFEKSFLKTVNQDISIDKSSIFFSKGIYFVNVAGDIVNVSTRLVID